MISAYVAAVVMSTTVVMLATGCSSKSSTTSRSGAPSTTGPVAASPTTSNLTGTWQGNAGVGARSTSLRMTLQQQGQALKGDIAVGGRPDLSGTVTGVVDGDTLRLQLENGSSPPQLRVQGDTITGVISGEPVSARRVR
jgi:endonuclease YncB( thermonuclease family)